LALGLQIAEGLAAAHVRGIVHRDIKPSNIMVGDDGRAKITDFGLAHLPGFSRLTSTGTSVGTISYMSPEQIRGNPPIPPSDVFSLGVVLYELSTGTAPFGGANAAAVMYQIMNTDSPPMA